MQVEMKAIEDLIPYALNARTHSDEQVARIAASIREFGFMNPILIDDKGNVIAGHGRLLAARKLGMAAVPCVVHSHLTEAQRKAYILADNKLALDSEWDPDLLRVNIEGLKVEGFDLGLIGFSDVEVDEILDGGEEDDPLYTRKVTAPTYEPTGEKPPVGDLYDASKTLELAQRIQAADIPDEEKAFLIAAASRHTVFNYEAIADYYAHSDAEVQRLMEESALVIIDFDRAIELGYIRLSERIADIYRQEKGDGDA